MKTMHSLRLALCGAAAFLTHTAFAQHWQTVVDFQYVPGSNAFAAGLTKDGAGNIYAAGDARDGAGLWHAVAMKSSDAGANWAIVDDYADLTGASNSGPGYDAGIAADAAGNLYAAGYDWAPGGPSTWFVRRSQDAGVTWSTVDSFTLGGSQAMPHALNTDSAGNVYVVGAANTASSTLYSITRKGIPLPGGGMTWSTVDSVSTSVFETSLGWTSGVFCHPTAGVFVAGVGSSRWLVRRSQNGGATWATADDYLLDPKKGSLACGIRGDAWGNLYAVGRGDKTYKGSTQSHWLVRKSSNGGASWATVDDFLGGNAYGFASDSNGNLFVTGQGWIVRKNPGGVGVWQTVDSFGATGKALIGDNAGNIFAAGSDYFDKKWLVRRGTP